MFTALLASAILGFAPTSKIEVNVKGLASGDALSTERTFRVTVLSDNPVTKVEFYVGDGLRDSDSSTPYEFGIDPLNEAEGALKLAFVAYTNDGEKLRKDYDVKIDTGVDKGADFHVEKGNEALIERKWDEALQAGRVALKARPGFNPARIIMARAYLGKGVMDKAQQFAEDAVAADPNYAEGREMLASINLKKAFSTLNRGGTEVKSGGRQSEWLKTISEALKQAVTYRRTNLDAIANKLPDVNDENRRRVADTNIRAMRYDAAVKALWPVFVRDPKNSAFGNRIAYAQVRQSKMKDAVETLRMMEKETALDAYGSALMAVVLAAAGDDAGADKVMADAIGNDPEDMGVRTGQVFIALKRGKTGAFGNLVTNLAKDEGQRTEVNHYLFIMLHTLRSFVDADERFAQATLAEPANSDIFVERGNQSIFMLSSRSLGKEEAAFQFELADAYFQAALIAWPDSPQALTAISIARSLQGKQVEAVKFAEAAMAAGEGYAAAHYNGAMVLSSMSVGLANRVAKIQTDAKGVLDTETRTLLSDLQAQARDYTERANKAKNRAELLDPKLLGGRSTPKANDVFDYFYKHGRVPLLTAP